MTQVSHAFRHIPTPNTWLQSVVVRTVCYKRNARFVSRTHNSDNETISLFDARHMNSRRPMCRTRKLGGGIWRIKWHPYTPHRMLVGAMDAGCRIVNFGGGCFERTPTALSWGSSLSMDTFTADSFYGQTDNTGAPMAAKSSKKFTEHESMAYGADWLVCPHPTQNGHFEAAARYVYD